MAYQLMFPKEFLWGASTSAHQVEGNLTNNWTEWERLNAENLAARASGQYASSRAWPAVKSTATNPLNYRSGTAVEHLLRQTEDIALMKKLGLTAYRFSVEWSRIEPEPGRFDTAVLAEYAQFCTQLRQAGIEPFVTLWHWTVPLWFYTRGDWLHPDAASDFTRFTKQVVGALGDEVRSWITLNEPTVYAHLGYLSGEWPPQRRNVIESERVLTTLQRAHKNAYQMIHALQSHAQVGIAHQLSWVTPRRPLWLNILPAKIGDWVSNWRFVNSVDAWQDFLGWNYYFHHQIGRGQAYHPHSHRSDMNWDLCPEGMGHVLTRLKRYGKPIYVMEHGLADINDQHRSWYLKASLAELSAAIAAGANVRGYFHWSLLDNFEWNRGFWPRFGLIAVDRQTQKRTLRPSAHTFASIIKSNTVET